MQEMRATGYVCLTARMPSIEKTGTFWDARYFRIQGVTGVGVVSRELCLQSKPDFVRSRVPPSSHFLLAI